MNFVKQFFPPLCFDNTKTIKDEWKKLGAEVCERDAELNSTQRGRCHYNAEDRYETIICAHLM